MRVVAVDPGKTTGLAWWASDSSDGQQLMLEERDLLKGIMVVHDILAYHGLDQIVCEDFIITTATAKKSRERDALDGIGALRYLAWRYGVPFKTQRPVDAKTFATDVLLKRIDWYRPGLAHARDASRHLLLFLVESGVLPASMLTEARDA